MASVNLFPVDTMFMGILVPVLLSVWLYESQNTARLLSWSNTATPPNLEICQSIEVTIFDVILHALE